MAQNRLKKVVYIIVDGVPIDAIKKLDLPHFNAIAKEGGFEPAMVGGLKGKYSETPTISAVGYNSILTGTWVNKHNVFGNGIKKPNYHYPTIFRLFKNQFPDKRIGIFSSWEDNRTKLLGEHLAATNNLKTDFHFDGLELDTINYPHDELRSFMHRIDQKVTEVAAETIIKEGPDLSWIYLEYTDDIGHNFGDSPKFDTAIKMADVLVGKIWTAIQVREKKFNEDWLIVVTTDHGRTADNGMDHGGQSDRERAGWILTNAHALNDYFQSGEASIVDIMPTVARHLSIEIPENVAREVDGVPLIGKLSLTDLHAARQGSKVSLKWNVHSRGGKVKIYLSETNNFKTGADDKYSFVKKVRVKKGKAEFDLKGFEGKLMKIVAEGKYNIVNTWLVENN